MSSYFSKYTSKSFVNQTDLAQVKRAFDRDMLAKICALHETEFAAEFEMDTHPAGSNSPDDFYLYRDNGASILAVAHLDTVMSHDERAATFVDTAATGTVVFSGALDDRLGAYVILDLLPKLGIITDLLLTTGEEQGQSTASFFQPPVGKQYNWVIEFDRGGTDVVMYQYDDNDTAALVEESGAIVGHGSFSDIAYLEHLGVKCFNWGVGYEDYHGPRSHAYLDDTFEMVTYFMAFHFFNADEYLPHFDRPTPRYDSFSSFGKKYLAASDDWKSTQWQPYGTPRAISAADADADTDSDSELAGEYGALFAEMDADDELLDDDENDDENDAPDNDDTAFIERLRAKGYLV